MAFHIVDFTKKVEIAKGAYWVGMYLKGDPFQCHPYFIDNGNESILIDPGSMIEFEATVKKIKSITELKNIKYIVLQHQDPDLCAAVPHIEKLINRDDLQIVTHSRMSVLIKHYGVTSNYYHIDENDLQLTTKSGLELQFLTTPYCHSPGAFVTYEPKNKILFSSDIFGGLEESWSFYADENYFDQAKAFHEAYMPSKDIFNYALSKIEKLDISLIAPQHGSVVKRVFIYDLIAKMKELDCGLYIDKKYNNELIDVIKKLKNRDMELEILNKELENRITKEVQKRVDADKRILQQQSKMAMVGEMMSVITHQWRQPLNTIGLFVQDLKPAFEEHILNEKYIDDVIQDTMIQIEYMSKTIEDFKDFFSPSKEKQQFNISDSFDTVQSILGSQLANNNIKFEIKGENFPVIGSKSELSQVFLNIINNAKDAILEIQKLDSSYEGKIAVLFTADSVKKILIEDNGGGIEKELISNIFDSYFTTKSKKGTGIGLYVSKMIIEKNNLGKIHVENIEGGSRFVIEFYS